MPTGPSVDAKLVDLDGDGLPDLIWLTRNSLQIWLQRNGTFSDLVYSRTLKSPRAIAVGDVNGDGAKDVFVLESNNQMYATDPDLMLVNNGTGTGFSSLPIPQATFGTGDAVWPIDYDNNGLTDFAVANGAYGGNAGPVELIAFFPDTAGSAAANVRARLARSGHKVVNALTTSPVGPQHFASPESATTAMSPAPEATVGTSGSSGAGRRASTLGAPFLVTANPGGVAGNARSIRSSVTAGGRYVAFDSWASDLVPGDNNLRADVFVRDTRNGSTELISVSSSGGPANLPSGAPRITPDGRYVAFYSFASNLVAGVGNDLSHIFVRDRQTRTTRVVDAAANGTLANGESGAPSLSADGRYIAFESKATNLVPGVAVSRLQVFVKDMQTGSVTLASANIHGAIGDGTSVQPVITPDGHYVAFSSNASDLTPDVDTKNNYDVFRRDLRLGRTVKVSVSLSGPTKGNSLQPSISNNGRYVSFGSGARNLVTVPVATTSVQDIFVRDIVAGTTTEASVAADGGAANSRSELAHLSADGSSVVFTSFASNLTVDDADNREDIFIRDLVHSVTTKVSSTATGDPLNAKNYVSSASPDNSHVVFSSGTKAIQPNPTGSLQLYERDMGTIETAVAVDPTQRISVSRAGGNAGATGSPRHCGNRTPRDRPGADAPRAGPGTCANSGSAR